MLEFITNLLNSNKRLEVSTPYDPVHLTHVSFNSSTGEFTGLPKEWQQLLQDSGISKSDQEKNLLAVMEVVKFYQEVVAMFGIRWATPRPQGTLNHHLSRARPNPPTPECLSLWMIALSIQ